MSVKGNRTNFVEFSRQLKPQPPEGSTPRWYFIGTLGFYKNGEKVWEQDIPEASNFFKRGFYDWLDVPRIYPSGCWVEHDEKWGWILKFRLSHEEAAKIWEYLFKHHPEIMSKWDPEKGQCFVKRPQPEEASK